MRARSVLCPERSAARRWCGSLADAALVGAKTVNGPRPESVGTDRATFSAVANVERSAWYAAAWTTLCGATAVVVVTAVGADEDRFELLHAVAARIATATIATHVRDCMCSLRIFVGRPELLAHDLGTRRRRRPSVRAMPPPTSAAPTSTSNAVFEPVNGNGGGGTVVVLVVLVDP